MLLKFVSTLLIVSCSDTIKQTNDCNLEPFTDECLNFIVNNFPKDRSIEIEDIKRTFCFDQNLGRRYDSLILNRLKVLFGNLPPYLSFFIMETCINYLNNEEFIKTHYEAARDYSREIKNYEIIFKEGEVDELTRMKINIFFLEYTCSSKCDCFTLLGKFSLVYNDNQSSEGEKGACCTEETTSCKDTRELLQFIPSFKEKIIQVSELFEFDPKEPELYENFSLGLSAFSRTHLAKFIQNLKDAIIN